MIEQINEEQWTAFTDAIGDVIYNIAEWLGLLDVSRYASNISEYHKIILDKNDTTVDQIREIFTKVRGIDGEYGEILRNLNTTHFESTLNFINALALTIEPENGQFSPTHMQVFLKPLADLLHQRVNNPAFDPYGSYGGNQGSAKNHYQDKDLQAIVRKYHPNYTEAQIRDYLKEMNSVGCGYVALCNTIFLEYIDDPDAFEEKFGFPMYKDGDLNFDALIVDFYTWCDRPGAGTLIDSRKVLWEGYCTEHGINVIVDNEITITPRNYDEIAEKGQVIIAISPVILEDENGKIVCNSIGGHAMTVTGVTEDGRYIVSSWGKTYYVDPDTNFNRLQLQQVRYQ